MTFDLTGSFLIATPAMGDPRFAQSVIYLCAHGPDGAFGLIVNRPLPDLRLSDVLRQLDITPGLTEAPVLGGGPVYPQRGFVLHTGPAGEDGQALRDGLALSASPQVLRAIAAGQGPGHWLLAMGYAGWGAGQLEGEIAQNAWLTSAADKALIFDPAPGDHQWRGALRAMGVDPASLSAVAGRA